MRHPGRIVLSSIQGGYFSFEAFREGKLVGGKFNYETSREESSYKHTRRTFLFEAFREGKLVLNILESNFYPFY